MKSGCTLVPGSFVAALKSHLYDHD